MTSYTRPISYLRTLINTESNPHGQQETWHPWQLGNTTLNVADILIDSQHNISMSTKNINWTTLRHDEGDAAINCTTNK